MGLASEELGMISVNFHLLKWSLYAWCVLLLQNNNFKKCMYLKPGITLSFLILIYCPYFSVHSMGNPIIMLRASFTLKPEFKSFFYVNVRKGQGQCQAQDICLHFKDRKTKVTFKMIYIPQNFKIHCNYLFIGLGPGTINQIL